MFLDFYKLREQPFGVTPDPRFLYMSETHREALASLFYGIKTSRGFMALIAKPGMGKTSILFRLMQNLEGTARTVFLFQTQCDSREFLKYLLADMGIHTESTDLVTMNSLLNDALAANAKTGKQFVVIVDEAQNLDPAVLETIRLLSDFETTRNKLMQIILAGQPQLGEKLASPSLVQLSQRISILTKLTPFSAPETAAYIDHRLSVAGHSGAPIFTPDAGKLIAELSQGIPRNINNLCFNALSWGYAVKKEHIDADIIKEVAAELDVIRTIQEPVPEPPAEVVPARVAARVRQEPATVPVFASAPAPVAVAAAPSHAARNVAIAAGALVVAFLAGYGLQNLRHEPVSSQAAAPVSAAPVQYSPAASAPNQAAAQPAQPAAQTTQIPVSAPVSSPNSSSEIAGAPQTAAGADMPRTAGTKAIVVKPNDTLWGLSLQYYGNSADQNFQKITEMNKISNPNHIEVGQKLILPVPPKVAESDSTQAASAHPN